MQAQFGQVCMFLMKIIQAYELLIRSYTLYMTLIIYVFILNKSFNNLIIYKSFNLNFF